MLFWGLFLAVYVDLHYLINFDQQFMTHGWKAMNHTIFFDQKEGGCMFSYCLKYFSHHRALECREDFRPRHTICGHSDKVGPKLHTVIFKPSTQSFRRAGHATPNRFLVLVTLYNMHFGLEYSYSYSYVTSLGCQNVLGWQKFGGQNLGKVSKFWN